MPRALFTTAILLAAGLPVAAAEPPVAGLEQAVRTLAEAGPPEPRARAAAWLGAVADARAQPAARAALVAALADPAAAVRRAAAASLARLPEPTSRAPLETALRAERDADVLPALLLALGALRDPAVGPALEVFGRHPAAAVRAAALTAVGDAGGENARPRLLAALRDPGGPDEAWIVRSAAVLALAKRGTPGDVAEVLAAMKAGDGWSRWLARSALAEAVPALDAQPLALLEHLVKDPDARVAVTAAAAFARAGHAERLLALLADASPGVRAAAASGAAQAGLAAATPRLLGLARSDPAVHVRWAASRALFRLGAPEGDELVLAALASPEAAVWGEAVAVLEQRTGERHGRDAAAWRAALRRRAAR